MPCCTNYVKMRKRMKKFKSINQLEAAKQQLLKHRADLEKAINHDWESLKKSSCLKNIAGRAFAGIFTRSEEKNGADFLSDRVSQYTAGLTKKMLENAGHKIKNFFRKNKKGH